MNGYSIYLKDNGKWGIDRTLNGVLLYSVRGQWNTRNSAIKKVHKLYTVDRHHH